MVIAKYRAKVQRLEEELAQLRAGRQALGGEAIPAGERPAAAAPPQQQQQGAAAVASGGDAAMPDAADPQQLPEQQRQQAPDGLWL